MAHCPLSPPKGMASQAPAEDQTTTRTSYLPLFSQRVKLCKPKVNSINCKTHTLPPLSRGRYSGTKETLSQSQVSTVTGTRQRGQCHGGDMPRHQLRPTISLLVFTGQPSCPQAGSQHIYAKTGLNTKKRGGDRERLRERNYPNNLCRNAQFRTHMS